MPKYKIVASKSQKKYTIIVSADSELEAKEKLHKENYSLLSVVEYDEKDIEGQKFLFQVEQNGDIKNGIIVGKDIFKVYVKLKDELGYNIIFLYPEGDEAHNSAEKKQKIMGQLEYGYELQQKTIQLKEQSQKSEQNFYLKKQLDETNHLIEKVIQKIEYIIQNKEKYLIEEDTLQRLGQIYESLVHMKGSTNISKLKEIGELALIKIAQIELQSVELEKNQASRDVLKTTNELLKKIGSKEQFIEHDKDIKKIFQEFFNPLKEVFSLRASLKEKTLHKKSKNLLDTESYGFLKTMLLLEKYKEKLDINTKEMHMHRGLFMNPFLKSEYKEKVLLKRKVIQQNISILKAKKTGSLSSYTTLKKGYHKFIEAFLNYISFFKKILFLCISLYIILFFIHFLEVYFQQDILSFSTPGLFSFLLLFLFFIHLSLSRNTFLFLINIVFFVFFSIFGIVNF